MLLGQILKREGYCTESDIMEALSRQQRGEERRIGDILVSEGTITEEQLKKALEIQKSGAIYR